MALICGGGQSAIIHFEREGKAMVFKEAYEALKQGAMVKCPEWAGYWKWEDDSIKMYCKDGRVLDIRESENVDYTLNFIMRDDWEIVGESNVFIIQHPPLQRNFPTSYKHRHKSRSYLHCE